MTLPESLETLRNLACQLAAIGNIGDATAAVEALVALEPELSARLAMVQAELADATAELGRVRAEHRALVEAIDHIRSKIREVV